MTIISREVLAAYLDDSLGSAETAQVEQALRSSDKLRGDLKRLLLERDRGETHSLGSIWRRYRLTCPTREELGTYLLNALEDDRQAYIAFHLEQVDCPFCQANLQDLQTKQEEGLPRTTERRKRFFDSSVHALKKSEPNG